MTYILDRDPGPSTPGRSASDRAGSRGTVRNDQSTARDAQPPARCQALGSVPCALVLVFVLCVRIPSCVRHGATAFPASQAARPTWARSTPTDGQVTAPGRTPLRGRRGCALLEHRSCRGACGGGGVLRIPRPALLCSAPPPAALETATARARPNVLPRDGVLADAGRRSPPPGPAQLARLPSLQGAPCARENVHDAARRRLVAHRAGRAPRPRADRPRSPIWPSRTLGTGRSRAAWTRAVSHSSDQRASVCRRLSL